jgi:SAM-dependent methyltransferase
MAVLYDTIGRGYGAYRRPDPRIRALLERELRDAASIVNLGAGLGSYEPRDRTVVAVEPSRVMIAQRPRGSAPVVQARAEALPLLDASFDAAIAVLTLHHWSDVATGLTEARRVARRRIVLLTWIPSPEPFWLMDYFPEIRVADDRICVTAEQLGELLGPIRVVPVPVPADCTDGFLCAYWRRPRCYLDVGARRAISAFSRIGDVGDGLARLRADLESGAWQDRHGHLLGVESMDLGYRIVVAEADPSSCGPRAC